ncbi:MAG: hypothetical protein QOD75_1908 [Blastocatellia bacterium]|jgi:hypothetical protein|nr:hypothetical protein [Blastocatellia bacterium]
MAKTIAKILGLVLLLVGILGFTAVLKPLGAHLNPAHNAVHILTGVIALYFGFAQTMSAARAFDLVFGAVYLLLGVCGYFLGDAGNMHMLHIGPLMLGNMDHMIHVAVGALFLIGGLMTGKNA